jgi:hypothetical protein
MKTPNHRRDRTITEDTQARGLQSKGLRTPRVFAALLCLFLLTPASCSDFNSLFSTTSTPKPAQEQSHLVLVNSKARVLSIDKEMRYAVLDTPKGNRTAWWDGSTEFLQGKKALSAWNAKPGDNVEIAGFESNGEIFLRKVFLK